MCVLLRLEQVCPLRPKSYCVGLRVYFKAYVHFRTQIKIDKAPFKAQVLLYWMISGSCSMIAGFIAEPAERRLGASSEVWGPDC